MKTIIISIFIFTSLNIYSQDIISLYQKLAKSEFCPINSKKMKEGMSHYLKGIENKNAFCIKILTIDKKNGYLTAQDPNNKYEMCYWNISNGDKLIGFTFYGLENQSSSVWHFYEYFKNDSLKEINNDDIIPKPLITRDEYFDYKKMQEENTVENYEYLEKKCAFSYKMILPKKGNNIKIYFEPFLNIDLKQKIRYKTDYKGIVLKWKDGFFVKGKWIK